MWLIPTNNIVIMWLLSFRGVVPISVSSIELCPSLSEVDCFFVIAEWDCPSIGVFYATKQCFYFINNQLPCFCAFVHLIFLILVFHNVLEPDRCFTLKMGDICESQ
jgi:hypothetical protein